jgi:hypothetical protein
MRDVSELGIKEFGSRPFPAVTEVSLREFECAFDVNLPESYVQFLRFANGGTLQMREYENPSTGERGGVNDFYGLGSREDDERALSLGKWDFGNLWGEARVFREFSPKPGIPFARDGGGNQLYLDYSQEIIQVSRLIFESKSSYHVAQSFEQFLDLLRIESISPSVASAKSKKRSVRLRLPTEE